MTSLMLSQAPRTRLLSGTEGLRPSASTPYVTMPTKVYSTERKKYSNSLVAKPSAPQPIGHSFCLGKLDTFPRGALQNSLLFCFACCARTNQVLLRTSVRVEYRLQTGTGTCGSVADKKKQLTQFLLPLPLSVSACSRASCSSLSTPQPPSIWMALWLLLPLRFGASWLAGWWAGGLAGFSCFVFVVCVGYHSWSRVGRKYSGMGLEYIATGGWKRSYQIF